MMFFLNRGFYEVKNHNLFPFFTLLATIEKKDQPLESLTVRFNK